MENIIVRKAVLSDLESLLRFEQGVIMAERPYDPTLKQGPTRYYDIEGMFDAPHIELLVAVSGNVLAGCGYARIETSKPYLQHRQHAYLGFMYVEPTHRGQGINKLILDALADWARSKGIFELRLDVYYGNEPAIKAYEKAGFSRHMIEMRKGLTV